MFKNMKFTTKLYSSYGLILSLMLAVTLVVLFSVKSLVSNFGWVAHTHKVLAKASSIEAAAVDMETGMRGYLLAGKADTVLKLVVVLGDDHGSGLGQSEECNSNFSMLN